MDEGFVEEKEKYVCRLCIMVALLLRDALYGDMEGGQCLKWGYYVSLTCPSTP